MWSLLRRRNSSLSGSSQSFSVGMGQQRERCCHARLHKSLPAFWSLTVSAVTTSGGGQLVLAMSWTRQVQKGRLSLVNADSSDTPADFWCFLLQGKGNRQLCFLFLAECAETGYVNISKWLQESQGKPETAVGQCDKHTYYRNAVFPFFLFC